MVNVWKEKGVVVIVVFRKQKVLSLQDRCVPVYDCSAHWLKKELRRGKFLAECLPILNDSSTVAGSPAFRRSRLVQILQPPRGKRHS